MAMKKFSGLGRGLQSLIPSAPTKVEPKQKTENVFYVEATKVLPNPNQPRRDFDPDALKELAQSIKKYGILQPLLVSKVEQETERGLDVHYELIAGERRLRAAKLAGISDVPVIIKDNFDEGRVKLEVALIENLQREDLNPVDEGLAYMKLHSDFGMTHAQIAEKVGKNRVHHKRHPTLGLAPNIREALRVGKISAAHGRSLLSFENEEKRQEIFKQILAGGYSTHDLEKTAQEHHRSQKNPVQLAVNSRFEELQKNLSNSLAAPVFIKSGPAGGRVEIKFATLEDLNKIVKIILD